MSNPSAATLAWNRARLDKLVDNVTASGNRLSMWLVVGNAGALLFVYKGMLESPTYAAALRASAMWFFVGLAAAFVGLAVGFFLSLRAMGLVQQAMGHLSVIVSNEFYIDRLNEAYPEHPVPEDGILHKQMEAAAAASEALKKPISRLWWPAGLAIALHVLSGLAFGLGATQPLREPLPEAADTGGAAAAPKRLG